MQDTTCARQSVWPLGGVLAKALLGVKVRAYGDRAGKEVIAEKGLFFLDSICAWGEACSWHMSVRFGNQVQRLR